MTSFRKPLAIVWLVLIAAISVPVKAFSNPNPDLLSGLLGNLISTDKVSVASLAGSWSYDKPAVTFKSDNLLKKAGGVAAATAAEEKLAPYYLKAGLDKLTFTVNSDSTFVMKVKTIKLNGKFEAADEDSKANMKMVFDLGPLKAISSLTAVDAYITASGSDRMGLTFDVSKLIVIIRTLSSISGNSTIKGISSLLEQYDGVTAGFELKRDKTK